MPGQTSFEPLSETQFKIPIKSLTAFKLSYDTATNISESSKSTLLGKIPDTWFEEKTKGFVNTWVKLSRKSVKTSFLSVRSSILGSSEPYEFSDLDNKVLDLIGAGLREHQKDDSNSSEENIQDPDGIDDQQFDLLTLQEPVGSAGQGESVASNGIGLVRPALLINSMSTDSLSSSRNSANMYDESYNTLSPYVDSEGYPAEIDILSPDISAFSNSGPNGTIVPETSRTSYILGDYFVEGHSELESGKDSSKYLNVKTPVVRFNTHHSSKSGVSGKSRRRIRNIAIVAPQPESINMEAIKSRTHRSRRMHVKGDKKVIHSMQRMKRMARRSGKSARKSTGDAKHKLMKKLLRSYQNGDIIKVDKMLVLIKIAKSVSQLVLFGENEPCDTRVHERWSEYLVVLRKSNKSSSSIEIQFYDVNKKKKSQNLIKPDISLPLSSKLMKVQFYSPVDKSISLIVADQESDDESETEKKKGAKIYILQCQDQSTSYKWLYFMREVLEYQMPSAFQIYIPLFRLTIFIEIPMDIVKEIYDSENEKYITINKLSEGYSIEHTGLVKYLTQAIKSKTESLQKIAPSEQRLQKFIDEDYNLWLCYKSYDRIEWANLNGHMLYLQNMIKSDQFQMELRQKATSLRLTKDYIGNILKEPTPIEGFLARLTDIFGDERTLLRNFYKVLYFYSCDNVLFYTKFYRAIPPSPGNSFLFDEKRSHTYEVANSMPEIFEQNPFPLDENGHIKWLNEEEFERSDKFALSELERRVHQIVKAEAAIDLCQIREIRKTPYHSITLAQKRFMNLVWYLNNKDLHDETIMDSLFEIEMIHGGIIKLQAPSQFIRDEWVWRLRDLKTYWFNRKNDDLTKLRAVRLQNETNLNIDEYTDSNIVKEAGNIELQHSIADPQVYSMDAMCLNRYVLMSGYLYVKPRVHSDFAQYFVVLCPGFLLLFHFGKRSKLTGECKETSSFQHYLTIALSGTYLHSGESTANDLLYTRKEANAQEPGRRNLPRLYANGWKSSEEEPIRCFSIWIGKKRNHAGKSKSNYNNLELEKAGSSRNSLPKNPGYLKMYKSFGFTGKNILFMARSRQERELWVTNILTEVDRYSSMARKN